MAPVRVEDVIVFFVDLLFTCIFLTRILAGKFMYNPWEVAPKLGLIAAQHDKETHKNNNIEHGSNSVGFCYIANSQ
jgi:hypothetical protein